MIRPNQLALGYGATMAAGVYLTEFSVAAFGLPTLGMLLILADGIFRPASSVLMPTITHGPREGRKIALTFDDGPDPEVTPQILDTLKEFNARATFYCIGRHSEQYPALMQRIVAEGHALGNHSYQHARTLNFRGAAFQQREIQHANDVIRRFAPTQPSITYRPPVGLKNPPLAKVMDRLRMPVVAWSVHSRDTRSSNPEKIARRVLNRLRPGDIVVMHDGHDLQGKSRPATADALRRILDGVRERNLKPVTIGELLGQ